MHKKKQKKQTKTNNQKEKSHIVRQIILEINADNRSELSIFSSPFTFTFKRRKKIGVGIDSLKR
jgi:hypothetical protein